MARSLIFLSVLCFTVFSLADDHIDGPVNPRVDLAGIYVFHSPQRPGFLNITLNTQSGLPAIGKFSTQSRFKIMMRKQELHTQGNRLWLNSVGDQLMIDCQFSRKSFRGPQKYSCHLTSPKFPDGYPLQGEFNQTTSHGDIAHSFLGAKADPFFISLPSFDGVVFRQNFIEVNPLEVTNGIRNVNVLSLSFEVNLQALGLKSGLYGVAGQSLWKNRPRGHFHKADRTGRPEIVNVGLHDSTKKNFLGAGDNPLKKSFNTLDPFTEDVNQLYPFQVRIYENIKAYDDLDGRRHWNEKDLINVSGIFSNDSLLINLNESCYQKASNFLEIERAIFNNIPLSGTCGGRDFSDDIFKKIYSFYIAGPQSVTDQFLTGINRPYQDFSPSRALSNEFPYLASPSSFDLSEFFRGGRLLLRNQEEL